MKQQSASYLEKRVRTLPLEIQAGFSAAKESADRLEVAHQFGAHLVGRGMLLAAMNELEKELPKSEVTKLVYAMANDYAWRKTSHVTS